MFSFPAGKRGCIVRIIPYSRPLVKILLIFGLLPKIPLQQLGYLCFKPVPHVFAGCGNYDVGCAADFAMGCSGLWLHVFFTSLIICGVIPARCIASFKEPGGITTLTARQSFCARTRRFACPYSPSAPGHRHSANGLAAFIGISPAPSRGPQSGERSTLRKYHYHLCLSWPRVPLRIRLKLWPFSLPRRGIFAWSLRWLAEVPMCTRRQRQRIC